MRRRIFTAIPLISIFLPLLGGCGGGGGGLSLTGGSIPPGTIKGLAVLPNAQPASIASVAAVSLATQLPVPVTATIDANGAFSVKGLPTATDLLVTVKDKSGPALKTVVPHTLLTTADPAADLGQIDATTTVVANALAQETKKSPARTQDIITGQTPLLTAEIVSEHQTVAQQQAEITDDGVLATVTNMAIKNVANSELTDFAGKRDTPTAILTLDILTGDIEVRRGGDGLIPDSVRFLLFQTQISGNNYAPSTIAAALATAGVTVSGDTVAASDTAQRSQLPGFDSFGTRITPFEAYAIAASPTTAGGLGLSEAQTAAFLTTLLSRK